MAVGMITIPELLMLTVGESWPLAGFVTIKEKAYSRRATVDCRTLITS